MAKSPIIYTGQNIRVIRANAGLSQLQLAELTGLSQPRISEIESGANITQKTLVKILDAISKYQKQNSHV